MRFPVTFKRQKGGASTDPALGSDTPPTTTPPTAGTDNQLTCRVRDVNGWPVQRIAVCWTTTAGAPVAINGDLYFWEDATAHWYKINDTVLSLKPNQLFFFDVATIGEPAPTTKNLLAPGGYAESGSLELILILTDPGAAVAGVYNVAMGPDLTTVGT
jgi:hypothetical protein